MRRLRCLTPSLAVLLWVSCAQPAAPPPRTGSTAAPRRTARSRPAPLERSDVIWSHVRRMSEAERELDVISPLREKTWPPWSDVVSGLDLLVKLHRAAAKAVWKRGDGTTVVSSPLETQFVSYHRSMGQNLRNHRKLLRSLYDTSAINALALGTYRAALKKLDAQSLKTHLALVAVLCTHVKSHGVRDGDPRFGPCLHDGKLWVSKFEALQKNACACKRLECAQDQQEVLNRYIRETKGVRVEKADAKRVAKAALKGQMCISKKLLEEKLKSLKRSNP